jgi:GNAT superfamily N-acetyltransferase
MPGLEIQPFADEHLDEAARLLADRHRRHREAEPLLTEPPDYRDEVAALWEADGASGAAAAREGKLVGFMLGIPKDEVWGPNVWVDPAGHAVVDPEVVRDLYAAAAGRWVEGGRTRHYVVAPEWDGDVLLAWSRLSFGQQQAYAVREIPDVQWPDGVRLANEQDLDQLVEIGPILDEYQSLAPVFSSIRPDPADDLREEFLEDLANPDAATIVAERDGRIVGCFFLVPTTASPSHSSLLRVEGAVLLAWAVTRPDVRGSGAGVALTEGGYAWAREHGYSTMVVDWRETNLLSSRFWPARGFRRTFVRLYRSIP